MNGGRPLLPESPYKGLTRFDDSELDERFFFGRDRETEIVASNLVASRLTVLYGPSGVGKSSLLRAGVVRRLRALVPAGGGTEERSGALPVVVDQWRDDPIAAIAAAAETRPLASPEELADALAERSAQIDGEVFLVLDQMEEYFVYHGRDRGGPLRDALAEILTRPTLRVHVLLGIRDDALAELDAFKGRVPGLFGNVLRLDHLDVDAARAAIVEPLAELEAMGGPRVVAEAALVAAVVDQVASGRIERRLAGRGIVDGGGRRGRVEAPYLQLVMERVWEVERSRGSTVLHAATLAELGGAGRIVQEHLERALANLDEPERELVARLFNQLVTPSGTKIAHAVGDLSRYAGEPADRLEDVLHTLSDERVVRALPSRNGGGARYEIYHDVLADAVLAWGARHEADRVLAEERAAARRRHRRLAAIVGLSLVALALMGLLTIYAFQQRSEARKQTAVAQTAQADAEASEQEAKDEKEKTDQANAELNEANAQLNEANADLEESQKALLEQTAVANENAKTAEKNEKKATDALEDLEQSNAALVKQRDKADAATARAINSKNEEVKQRKKAQKALADEEKATRRAVVARDQARASDLVSQAITLQGTDPEKSLRVALNSARIARTPRLEIALRDGLKALRTRAVLPGGGGAVRTVSTSPDGTLVLVPADGGEARVYQSDGKLVARLPHGSSLNVAAFSPDGRTVVTGGTDGIARRWNARTGAALGLSNHGAGIRQIAFSPDGRLFATAAGEAARVWLAADGSPVAQLQHPFAVDGVSFNPAGTLLMTLARDARLYDTSDWQRPPLLLDQPGQIQTASFAPVGPLVATGGRDDLAMVWDSRDATRRFQTVAHGGDVIELAWSPRADLIATASSDNGGRVFRADTGALVTFLGAHTNQIMGIAFNPDGGSIATASVDGTARIFSAGPMFALVATLAGHSGQVLDVRFGGDGRSIVTASTDGSARVWQPSVDPILSLVGRHDAAGRAVAISRDGSLIASVGLDRVLRIWQRNGRQVRSIPHPSQLLDVAFSQDGKLLVTAGQDGVARVWRVADGGAVQSFPHGAPLNAASFDPSGTRVVTAGADGIARIWRRAGGSPHELRHGGGAMLSAAFSPDGRFVATAGQDTEGRVWRASTRKLLGKLRGQHDDDVTSIAWSSNGRRLVTSSLDADGHVWNARTFAHVRPLRGHSSIVSDIAFSPDGRWIATAGPTTVGLWETTTNLRVETGKPFFFVRGHGPRVRSVAFAPDSRRVVSIGDDGTVRTYLCEICGTTSELIRKARARLQRLEANLTPAQRKQYLGG